ncbi:MAG: hypothetical protein HAW67_06325 [Endozoicomonadaceae bacterium]|nr:hypothetical protein [Endozoicomonadaceae bacterium]
MPHRYGLINKNKVSCILFLELCPDFLDEPHLDACEFMNKYWGNYRNFYQKHQNNSMNGAIFELLCYGMLIRNGITPFYIQSNVAFVPNVRYDVLLNTQEYGPLGLSLKTSLRERYKQADLEAYVLKNVHRKSMSFIITANEDEAVLVNKKITKGDLLALDYVYSLNNINELVDFLNPLNIIPPLQVQTIIGRQIK